MAHALELGPLSQGLLTGLPIFAIGLASGFADRIARRIGWVRGVMLACTLTALGTFLRSAGGEPTLYVGALLLGLGIGLGNAYVPALLKAHFATRIGVMMGVYTMVLSGGALVAVAATLPLLHAFGGAWQPTLGIWGIAAAAAVPLWLPLLRLRGPQSGNVGASGGSIWRSRVAWSVAITMGLQSTLFYALASWLPTLLLGRGLAPAGVSLDLSIFYLTQPLVSLCTPVLMSRARSQSVAAGAIVIAIGIAIAGMLYGPLAATPFFAFLLGGSIGGFFGSALTFVVLRARNAVNAGRLSGMAQSVGYLIASVGPFLLGLLRAARDPLAASAVALELLCAALLVSAWLAGRDRTVEGEAAAAA